MEELLDAVVCGRYPVASWLPGIEELAARHGYSLGTVREAIRALEARGVLAVLHGRGQQVLPDDRWDLLDHDIATAILVTHPDREALGEAAEAFRVAAVQVAMLAAERAGPGDPGVLDAALDRMRMSHARRFVEAETDFHRAVALISGNRFLASMPGSLPAVLATARQVRAPDRNAVAVSLLERVAVAIRHRDPLAAAAGAEEYGTRLAAWLRRRPSR